MRVVLHPEARAELRAAALWFDEQRPGLGGEFVAFPPARFWPEADFDAALLDVHREHRTVPV